MGTLEKRHALTSLAAGAIAPAMALYPLLRPLIFSLDAERAHHLTLASLKALPTGRPLAPDPMLRSEEHTSELQSLMRISYAVFCLKKKSKIRNNTTASTGKIEQRE